MARNKPLKGMLNKSGVSPLKTIVPVSLSYRSQFGELSDQMLTMAQKQAHRHGYSPESIQMQRDVKGSRKHLQKTRK